MGRAIASREARGVISLPWPPSVNRYWRKVGARVLISREGREFRAAAAVALQRQMAPRFGRRKVRASLVWYPPDARRRDGDNLLKAIFDALQCAGVVDDDSQIEDFRVRRGAINRADPCVTVDLEAM